MSQAFVLLRIRVESAADAELAAAEAWAAGASGCEEREVGAGILLLVYAPRARAAAVEDAVASLLGSRARVEPPCAVPEQDWAHGWRAWHVPCEISRRLVVRPSFAALPAVPGRQELVIDPGQAFGTGAHASTRLALELLSGPLYAGLAGARVLDAGVGSGVLALAALRLGAGHAVGFDLDPRAAPEARAHARANGLEARFAAFTGPVHALAAVGFDLVLANLLRSELEPILPALLERVAPSGRVVISGLLESERSTVARALRAGSLAPGPERCRSDDSGARWLALTARR